MKKFKIFLYSLLALMVAPCALLFVACGKTEQAARAETCSVILVVDGHQYKTEEVEKGSVLSENKLTELLGITKTGHTFNGWYRDSALTERYNYETAVNSPLVLFSEFNVNKYNVTYVLGNGADDIVIREDFGTALEKPSNPVRVGYTFVGWDKDLPDTMPAENTTITASWREFTVSVDTNIEGACTLADYTVTNVLPGVQDLGGKLNVDISSVNLGYTFLGWFEGDTCRATKMKYSHDIVNRNTNLIAKFEVAEGLENFEFVSTTETLKITGVINRDATKVVVPDIATEIEFGALSGMKYLQELDLPFIGGIAGAKATSLLSPFGYVFGDADEADDVNFVEFKQTISYKPEGSQTSTSTTQTFYGPLSLKKLVVHQTSYFTGVFQNINKFTNLDTIYFAGSITAWINASFPSDTANPMSSSVAEHFYYLEEGNYVELTTLVVPASIKEIKQNTFSGFTGLTKVILDSALKKISSGAFKGLNAGDVEFYYIGTPDQWETNVTITNTGNGALKDPGALIYYYAENRPSDDELALHDYWYYDALGNIQMW